ncbi:MAG: aldehyde dehydrogenase family protein, partial [Limnobacter sp.]|nr:aldehyde dehydrogenase family protein [Limnobacter sp.]
AETQVSEVLDQAVTAFDAWRNRSFAGRADILRAVAKHMRENVEELAPIMTEEMGKPITEARGEVNKAAWCAEHYAEHAESYLAKDVIASDATNSYVQYLPLGTILGILPWNAPLWLAFRYLAPALMAGNTCLLKHDPHVPGSAKAIVDAFERAGAPANIVVNLPIKTPQVEAVIRDERVQAVSFTGSSEGGRKVAAMAASEIKPAVLELGGSDPCIVLADANLEKAADVVTLSRIINAGQSCIAAKRILIEAPVYEQFTEMLKERLSKLRQGDPCSMDTDIGPIAREDLRDNLHNQVLKTVHGGARLLLGGELPGGAGFHYPVTLLADVKPGMCAFEEETFGPVMVVSKVDNFEQAMDWANDTPYGLGSSIWT